MSVLDVFNSDVYGVVSLTESINKLPYAPSFLSKLGLFSDKAINSTTAMVEERQGTLSLISTAARGTIQDAHSGPKRVSRAFSVPHIPDYDSVLADDVQGVRPFGSESGVQTVVSMVNDKLASMKQDHEATSEWHKLGAVKGEVLDADGTSVIYNWFTEFGIAEKVINWPFTTSTAQLKLAAMETKRHIADALGGTVFTGVMALCGDTWYDDLTTHPSTREAYALWQKANEGSSTGGEFLRGNQAYDSFMLWGITFVNYRGAIGSQQFIGTSEARFFPTGAPKVFQRVNAPADYIETVNTMGKPLYAKQVRMKWDKGIEIGTQANSLHICTRPGCLVDGNPT